MEDFDWQPEFIQNPTSQKISNILNLLTDHTVNKFNNLKSDNDKMKCELNFYKDENKFLKKRKRELEEKNTFFETILKEKKQKNKIKKSKIVKIKKYRKNKSSFDSDTIKRTIRNIKSIDDIINLEGKWKNIKHHLQLQKLYHLIEPLKKLQKMIGLNQVKKEVMKKIIYYIQNPSNEEYLHTIISGPPGVGKTEVSKIYAEIFQKLGILKNNSFIEVKRDQLVGKYLGHTAAKTRELLDSAMGGVVFIDEAYSLGNAQKRDSFSKEAIDMINQYLSEYKNDFMMIVAGYEDELNKCFFSYNPGLKRRFSTHFKISGYKGKELIEIFKIKTSRYESKISENELKDFFNDTKIKESFPYFGGDIEKLVNELKYVQANRTFYQDNQDDNSLTIDDLNNAFDNFTKNNGSKKNVEPPFGMYL